MLNIDFIIDFVRPLSPWIQAIIFFLLIAIFLYALVKAFIARFETLDDLHSGHPLSGLANPISSADGVGLLVCKALYQSEQSAIEVPLNQNENQDSANCTYTSPQFFYADAVRQFALNEVELQILDPIEGWSNALPPLGFLGTVLGMMTHFFSNGGAVNTQINSSGIATALGSTILALFFYVILEIFSLRIRRRALKCIDSALSKYNLGQRTKNLGH